MAKITRRDILQLVLWIRMNEMEVSEWLFFRRAYVCESRKLDERQLDLCFQRYKEEGIIPLFVRQFIRDIFLKEGGNTCTKKLILSDHFSPLSSPPSYLRLVQL